MVKIDFQGSGNVRNSYIYIFQNILFLIFYSSINLSLMVGEIDEDCIFKKILGFSLETRVFFEFSSIFKKQEAEGNFPYTTHKIIDTFFYL